MPDKRCVKNILTTLTTPDLSTGGVLEKNNPGLGCVGETHHDAGGACVSNLVPRPDGSCVLGYHSEGRFLESCVKDTPTTGGVLEKNNPGLGCVGETHYDNVQGACITNYVPLPDGIHASCVKGWHLVATVEGAPVCNKDEPTKTTGTGTGGGAGGTTIGICKLGYHQDAKTGQCILTCDLGYHYGAAKDLCVPDAKTTPAQLPTGTGGGGSTTGGNKNSTTGQEPSSTSSTTIKIINKNIFEGSQPIGSSSSTPSDTIGKLFLEFNNRTNAAAGLVVTNTTLTKNQLVSGQVDINGHIQNIRPADTSTTANTNTVNTARMIVVVATFYDKANNTISVQHGGYDPNTLGPGQSSVFHLVANNAGNNIDHAVYLFQWLGLDGGNGALLLHPTTQEVNGAAATFPTK